jgi:integrase
LSGLQHYVPRAKGRLKHAWRLYKAWDQNEQVRRATPLSPEMLLAVCGRAWHHGEHGLCISLLLGYHCLLRTGEILNLRLGDVDFARRLSTAVLRLGWTKGGQRRGTTEEVICDDERLADGVREYCRGRDSREALVELSGVAYRKWFAERCSDFAAGRRLRFTPYSLRRGGALYHFSMTGSFSSLTQRGRWSSERTARTYLSETRQELERQKLSAAEETQLLRASRLLTI